LGILPGQAACSHCAAVAALGQLRLVWLARILPDRHKRQHTLTYALTALRFTSLVLAASAAAAAALSHVDHEMGGLQIPLTSDF